MRESWEHLERYRATKGPAATNAGERCGQFLISFDAHTDLAIIACDGANGAPEAAGLEAGQWEHVSVHARDKTHVGTTNVRVPTWGEMHHVKQLFWGDAEAVMQLHPPQSDYINLHRCVLHLWRPKHKEVPLPPVECV